MLWQLLKYCISYAQKCVYLQRVSFCSAFVCLMFWRESWPVCRIWRARIATMLPLSSMQSPNKKVSCLTKRVKGPIHDNDFQPQPRCAARSRLRLLLMVYPHTQRPICSIFLSSLIVTMSDLASDDQIAHQISENSDQQQPPPRPASCGGGCGCWSPYTGNLVELRLPLEIAVAIEDRCRGWGP